LERAPDAVDALLEASGLPMTATPRPRAPVRRWRDLAWLKHIPQLGADVQNSLMPPGELLEKLAMQRGACLVCDPGPKTVLAVVFDSFTTARIIRPDRSERTVARRRVMDLVRAGRSLAALEGIFEGLPGGNRALRALLARHVASQGLLLVTFSLDAAHPLHRQLSAQGAFRALGAHIALVALQGVVTAGAIFTLGSTVLDGHVDSGRVAAWTILSLTAAPMQYLASRALRRFTVALGARMKRRLLEGTFRIDEREIRKHGYGSFLGRANEASLVERIDLINVFDVTSSVAQLVLAGLFFEQSRLFQPLLALLLLAILLLVLLGHRLFRSQAHTYRLRLALTSDLVDKILGHRTRAVQQSVERYHRDEDRDLTVYGQAGRHNDNLRALAAGFPRIWLTIAGAVPVIGFVMQEPIASLGWAVLGVVVAQTGFAGLAGALQSVATWWTAYQGVQPFLKAGALRERPPRRPSRDGEELGLPVVLSASSVSYAYRSGGSPILNGASVRVHRGEKVLVTGPSGGGKTTLFKLLGGEMRAGSGVILVEGNDPHIVSQEEWREHVASAPQFHENYVFAQPLAFNLDPRGELANASPEAEAICAELGLDGVIARMPQGYAQLLGETGWQLSHGERSRLFIARALLQGADLFLFDESFGALDPETQAKTLECVRKRARTLMVIAHP
jgi:ATP-binding cassette subfamily B protein